MSSEVVVCFCLLVLACHTYGVSIPGLMPRFTDQIRHMEIRRPVPNTFKFQNCGGPKDLANFTSLIVGPNPILPPTDLTVSFAVDVFEEVGDELDLNVTLCVKFRDQWKVVPCVLDIGSCYYADVCSYLEPIIVCPDEFVKHNIPCKCPFKTGKYSLPGSTFRLNNGLPASQYLVKVALKQDGRQVACGKIEFEFV